MALALTLLSVFMLLCILFGVLLGSKYDSMGSEFVALVLAIVIFGAGAFYNAVEFGKKQATIEIIKFNKPPYELITNADGTSEWVMVNKNGQK